jgi:hypothetical protein
MMSPDDERRYLAWVEETCLNMTNMPIYGQ